MKYDLKHYAYIGDAVWEIFIRKISITKSSSLKKMHEYTTSLVCYKAQANIINFLMDYLTEEELEIQKRGRNLKITINKKNDPKVHSLATSFETLIGYLYIENRQRLTELFKILNEYIKNLNEL